MAGVRTYESIAGDVNSFSQRTEFSWGTELSLSPPSVTDMYGEPRAIPYAFHALQIEPGAETFRELHPDNGGGCLVLSSGDAMLDFQVKTDDIVSTSMLPGFGYAMQSGGLCRIRNTGTSSASVLEISGSRSIGTDASVMSEQDAEFAARSRRTPWPTGTLTPYILDSLVEYSCIAEDWFPYRTLEANRRVSHAPWGSETFFTALGGSYAFSVMEIDPGQRLSLHKHSARPETHVVLGAQDEVVLYESLRSEAPKLVASHMTPQRGYTVRPRMLHCLENVGERPAMVYGASGPRNDITIRVEDEYGRYGPTDNNVSSNWQFL